MGIDWEEILDIEENEDLFSAYERHVDTWGVDLDFEEDSDPVHTDEYVIGNWNGKEVRFKRVWGGYRFTEEEIDALLNGQEIRFRHTLNGNKEQDIVGKLENREFRGRKYVGFSPSSWNE
ncbi:TPA: DNA topoisomerase I [Streptococcus suis]